MNRREASKEETRRLILKAARKLLVRKGGEDCTMKDIALEAGTSPASVVVHFKNRITLLEEALYSDIEKNLLALKDTLPQKAPLLERLIHIPNGFFAFYSRNRNLYRALLRNTIFEPQDKTPHMTQQADQYIQSLTLIIEEEKGNGVIRHDVDTRIAAASIFSLYLGVLTTLFRTPELPVETLIHIHSSMVEHFLRGIMNKKD
jgi:AcrR family transcriptional regulator